MSQWGPPAGTLRAMTATSPAAGDAAGHTGGRVLAPLSSPAAALAAAEAAYAADADHLARYLLIGLVFEGAVTQEEIGETIARGLARYRQRLAQLRALAGSRE
jgi:hypothetical protein